MDEDENAKGESSWGCRAGDERTENCLTEEKKNGDQRERRVEV